ncbi:hypothetical protein CASFOL_008778 [Castilleja foliolosa]|uniref:Uncharacterized protein n=1 Tax=Castilleja foliolosa TaxID=1961234 RepID=A0ABD3DZY3_9LAMI
MPDEIAKKFLGREGLFEVVVSSQRLHDDGFNVSRLTVDDEIKDVYIVRNYPAANESNPEDDSFLQTLDYVEKDEQEAESAIKDIAAEIESETNRTPKRQKMEGTD